MGKMLEPWLWRVYLPMQHPGGGEQAEGGGQDRAEYHLKDPDSNVPGFRYLRLETINRGGW